MRAFGDEGPEMAHFLRLSGLPESLEEIDQAARYIEHLFSLPVEDRKALLRRLSGPGRRATYESELRRALETIYREVGRLRETLERFRSDPIIYTGSGSTDEVLGCLERAVAASFGPAEARRAARAASASRGGLAGTAGGLGAAGATGPPGAAGRAGPAAQLRLAVDGPTVDGPAVDGPIAASDEGGSQKAG